MLTTINLMHDERIIAAVLADKTKFKNKKDILSYIIEIIENYNDQLIYEIYPDKIFAAYLFWNCKKDGSYLVHGFKPTEKTLKELKSYDKKFKIYLLKYEPEGTYFSTIHEEIMDFNDKSDYNIIIDIDKCTIETNFYEKINIDTFIERFPNNPAIYYDSRLKKKCLDISAFAKKEINIQQFSFCELDDVMDILKDDNINEYILYARNYLSGVFAVKGIMVSTKN